MSPSVTNVILENSVRAYRVLLFILALMLAKELVARIRLRRAADVLTAWQWLVITLVVGFLLIDPLSTILNHFMNLINLTRGMSVAQAVGEAIEGIVYLAVVAVVYRSLRGGERERESEGKQPPEPSD